MPMSGPTSADLLTHTFTSQSLPNVRPTAWFISLHTDSPAHLGDNEVDNNIDDAYIRVPVSFTVVDGNSDGMFEAVSSTDVVFNPAEPSQGDYSIGWIGVWSAQTGGRLLAWAPLPDTIPVTTNTQIEMLSGTITFRGN